LWWCGGAVVVCGGRPLEEWKGQCMIQPALESVLAHKCTKSASIYHLHSPPRTQTYRLAQGGLGLAERSRLCLVAAAVAVGICWRKNTEMMMSEASLRRLG